MKFVPRGMGVALCSSLLLTLPLFLALPADAQSYTVLHTFDGSDGQHPLVGLVQGTDGNFYGTTDGAGLNNDGTVFKITPSGTLTTLYSFAGSDGKYPYAALVQGSDGNFYGMTLFGGTSGTGTVFKITPGGTLTTLHSFAGDGGDGADPEGALVQGTDGNFYGTTWQGGAGNLGTVFKITPGGTLTSLYSFSGSDGAYPQAGLVQGSDGDFYGTTWTGGTGNFGTVFKITSSGTLTTLHSFAGSDGSKPYLAALAEGGDGNFYGTASEGGASNLGTVFKITPGGTLTTLHSFARSDGAQPEAGLVLGSNGNFYGTTFAGGTGNVGTVFEITPGGALTTLHSFAGSDGENPEAGLVQGSNGAFYGMTTYGGPFGDGVVFRWIPPEGLASLFYPLTPCRVIDTRIGTGPLGGPALAPNATRDFDVSGVCGIPAPAVAISANLTVTNVGARGELVVFPADVLRPNTSTLSFRAGRTRANNALVSFSKSSATFSVFNNSAATVDFILDVNGFFR